jgi:hypothetical protein
MGRNFSLPGTGQAAARSRLEPEAQRERVPFKLPDRAIRQPGARTREARHPGDRGATLAPEIAIGGRDRPACAALTPGVATSTPSLAPLGRVGR